VNFAPRGGLLLGARTLRSEGQFALALFLLLFAVRYHQRVAQDSQDTAGMYRRGATDRCRRAQSRLHLSDRSLASSGPLGRSTSDISSCESIDIDRDESGCIL
jgi:hypothetical protein